jgi:hypothetical protein
MSSLMSFTGNLGVTHGGIFIAHSHGTKSNQTPPQAAHDAAAPPLSPALIAAINTNHHMSPPATAVIDNRSVAIYT